jgi:general secretion pathway protein I
MRTDGSRNEESRGGITLFEVVLALAIFIGAFAAISQILRNGGQAATRAQLTSEGALRCQSRMNEAVAGVVPLQPSQNVPFEDDPRWQWSLNVYDGPVPGLLEVETIVAHPGSRGASDIEVRLVRWIRDPDLFFEAALSAEVFP